jgi:hypothetical protein
MNAKLETAIRSEVFAAIPAKYLSTEERLELDQLDLRRLLSVFFNWRNRFITPRARTVHLSAELSAKNASEINGLVERIDDGDDLNPHLSTRVEKVYTARAARRSNRLVPRMDLDLLLSDWGIYHLHISTVDRGDGFVENRSCILYGSR